MNPTIKFSVKLTRKINREEFDFLCSAILAQCEEVTLKSGEDRPIGYISGSDKFELINESKPLEVKPKPLRHAKVKKIKKK